MPSFRKQVQSVPSEELSHLLLMREAQALDLAAEIVLITTLATLS